MSHITNVETELDDERALKYACGLLAEQDSRVGMLEDVKPRFYYSAGSDVDRRENKVCEVVLKLPGKYDLGFHREENGTYSLVCDNELLSGQFGSGDAGRKFLGDHAAKFMEAYDQAKVELMLLDQGLQFTKDVDAEGNVHYMTQDPVEAGVLRIS